MTPNTFTYDLNRDGRPWRATGYACSHGVLMRDCPQHTYGREVERHMVDWWNDSFIQMQDRMVVRDTILRGKG